MEAGPQVAQVQGLLNLNPPSKLADLKADGIFGDRTRQRVVEFQGNVGLTKDGIVGPLTVDALCLTLSEVASLAATYGRLISGGPQGLQRRAAYDAKTRQTMLAITPVAGPQVIAAPQVIVVVAVVLAVIIVFYIAMLNLLPAQRKAHDEFARVVERELNKLREAMNLPTPMGLMSRAVESIRTMVREFIETLKRSRGDCDQSPEALANCSDEAKAVAVAEQNLVHKLGELTFIGVRGFKLDDLTQGILISVAALVKAYHDLGKCLKCDSIRFLD